MKILFITANRVGDAVLTTGLLAWLAQHYPDAHFTIACGPYGADIFRAVPRLEKLIVMRKKKWNGHWIGLWRECFGTKWDLIIDLRNSIVSWLLRADKCVRHTKSSGKHKVVDNGAVMGLDPPPNPHIWITPEALQEAEKLLPHDAPLLALAPAANWGGKQWPINYFIDLAQRLTAAGGVMPYAKIMIIADKHERAPIMPLLQAIPDAQRIEMIGHDLQIAAACLKQARLFVGNDSGLMHMSAALGVPTLGLFGPGFPHIYGPWGERCAYVATPESREELLRLAPQQACLMGSLSVERAVEAATRLFEKTE
jgi:lipopolysaccharide export system permease protein